MLFKTKRTLVASLAAIAASALLLTACSGDAEPAPEAPDTPTTQAPENGDTQMVQEIHDMLPDRIKESGVLNVGTEAFYPPYDYFADDEKTIIGLDPDIDYAIGAVLGVEVKLENMSFDGLLPALDAKRIDIVSGALGINPERVEKYDFVSYFNATQGITVTSDNPKNVSGSSDLCGLNVSVLEASHQLGMLQEMNENECASNEITILAFATDADALQQLQTGRADAHLAQYAVAVYAAENFGDGSTFKVVSDEAFGLYILGKVIRKDDNELRDAVQAAVNHLVESGQYVEILKAHGLEAGAIDKSEINPL